MKFYSAILVFIAFVVCSNVSAQDGAGAAAPAKKNGSTSSKNKTLFIDVHHLGAGKVTYADVAKAHAKDLATQGKYGVKFIKYWVDIAKGDVYCLSSASNDDAIRKTHAAATGMIPDNIYPVTDGKQAPMKGGSNLYLDVHEVGAGKVTAADVAGAHQKDLAVQKKYGVNLINYWLDAKDGVIMCLAEAPDANALVNTHKEAHGLLPKAVASVKQGH